MHSSGLLTGSAKFRVLSGDPAFRFELVLGPAAYSPARSAYATGTLRPDRIGFGSPSSNRKPGSPDRSRNLALAVNKPLACISDSRRRGHSAIRALGAVS